MCDLQYENHGTIFLLFAASKAGREWIEANLPKDAMTLGSAVVVEHRFIANIAAGAMADGLMVQQK